MRCHFSRCTRIEKLRSQDQGRAQDAWPVCVFSGATEGLTHRIGHCFGRKLTENLALLVARFLGLGTDGLQQDERIALHCIGLQQDCSLVFFFSAFFSWALGSALQCPEFSGGRVTASIYGWILVSTPSWALDSRFSGCPAVWVSGCLGACDWFVWGKCSGHAGNKFAARKFSWFRH